MLQQNGKILSGTEHNPKKQGGQNGKPQGPFPPKERGFYFHRRTTLLSAAFYLNADFSCSSIEWLTGHNQQDYNTNTLIDD